MKKPRTTQGGNAKGNTRNTHYLPSHCCYHCNILVDSFFRLESKLEQLLDIQIQLETKVASLREARKKQRSNDLVVHLQRELQDLRNKSMKDQERLSQLTDQLHEKEDTMVAVLELKLNASVDDTQAMGDELALRETIKTLQNTNQAFIKALSHADHIWATCEQDYKQRLTNMEIHYEAKIRRLDLDVKRLSGDLEMAKAKALIQREAAKEKVRLCSR